ncbi:MAG: hypothetical protein ACYC3S_13265 [Chloroflexota bacterium]
MSESTSGITLYRVQGGGDEAILLDPAAAANEVANGERLGKGRTADLLGIRRDELDELAADGLIVLREDADGKPYVTAAAFRKFLKGLEPIQFIEAPADEDAEDYDDEEEEVAVAKGKPAGKAAASVAEDEAAEENTETEADQVSISGPAAAVAAFFKNLFGGEQVISEGEAEVEAEPAPVKRSNPLFGFGKSRKSGRRSGR